VEENPCQVPKMIVRDRRERRDTRHHGLRVVPVVLGLPVARLREVGEGSLHPVGGDATYLASLALEMTVYLIPFL